MSRTEKIKDMVAEQRPYEKCEQRGVGSLTDIELLAVLLRSGTRDLNSLEVAKKVLYPDGMKGGLISLHDLSVVQLMKIPGIGRVKALQIICIVELSRRLSKSSVVKGPDFSSPAKIAEYYMEDMRQMCIRDS